MRLCSSRKWQKGCTRERVGWNEPMREMGLCVDAQHGVCGFERSSLKLSHAILDRRERIGGFVRFVFGVQGVSFTLFDLGRSESIENTLWTMWKI